MSVRTRLLNPLAALDDRALLARFFEQHDQSAFEQIVKRHGRLVFGVCRRVVRDSHLAEDAFQAVFLVLARNPKGAAEAVSVGGWLFGIARRVGLAARRQEQRRERRELKAGAPDVGGALQSDLNDLLRALDEELATLPDDLRAALVACFLEERTQDEAARELGWSLSTLRRRLESGKELLRSRLARRGVALGAGLLTGALANPARAAVPALNPSPAGVALANELLKRGIGLKLSALVAVAALAVGGFACGFTKEPEPQPVPLPATVSAGEAVESAPAPRPVTPRPWATVSARVVLPTGQPVPRPKLVPAGQIKDADRWKPFGPVTFEDVSINPDTRGIANALVWLRPDSDDLKAAFPNDKILSSLRNSEPKEHTVQLVAAQFRPRVLAVRAGDTLAFENRLEVATNVHYIAYGAEAGRDHGFNRLLGHDMTLSSKPLPAGNANDMFQSTVHSWMRGFVRAFDHPYFAVTDANGRFELKDAPAGAWRLVVWHEAVGYLGGINGKFGSKITIPEGRTGKHELDSIEFKSDRWPSP